MKIAVIGAGPAGMTAAYTLARHNIQVDIYEATDQIGGLCRTIDLWGQKVDLGPHRFFSSDRKVNQLWLDVVGDDYEMVSRLTRIYYRHRFFNYPLKIGNVMNNLGVPESLACICSYFYEGISGNKNNDGSFEEWVKGRFGKRLYNMFFKTYTEKLWGIKCDQLDADFAMQRIRKLSLYEAVKNAIIQGKGNSHKTLVDQFAYPLGGTGSVYRKMADFTTGAGSQINLNTPVYRIVTASGKVTGIELNDGTFKPYDHVVTSMPFTSMVHRLPDAPEEIRQKANQLSYRNTVIVYLLIDSTDLFPDNWLYVHSTDLHMGRITNFRNWSESLYGKEKKSILAVEYWCSDKDPIWSYDDSAFIRTASSELIKTRLVDSQQVIDGYVYRISKSYPVYSRGYKQILAPIEEYVASIRGLYAIGRYGSFKYNNQDHSILMGIFAAENIMGKASHKLDEVNSDYETYQESCIITDTGLVER